MLFLFILRFFKYFFPIPVVKENAKLKLSLAILTGAPRTLANNVIETPPLATGKTIKVLLKWSKTAIYLLSSLLFHEFQQ